LVPFDNTSNVSIWLLRPSAVVFSAIASATIVSAAMDQPATTADIVSRLSSPAAIVGPRAAASYGALMIAATLGVLYLYRGRAFIVYWIGAWLFIAAALALVSIGSGDVALSAVLLGVGVLLIVWAAGLVLMAVLAFPVRTLQWTHAVRFAAVSAVWFLAGPFLIPPAFIVGTGVLVGVALLSWAAYRYLQLSHRNRYAGALLIGLGLTVIALSNAGGSTALLNTFAPAMLNQLAVVNMVTSIFVALGMHLLVFEDMTVELRRTNRELAAANEEVRRLAITDALTGCFNRRFFEDIERRELQRRRRYGVPLSVVFVDVDRFKWLNDTRGHETGDAVLRAIGGLLRARVRETDYVIRWGGDEFLLLLTCTADQAARKAVELKAAFRHDPVAADLPPDVALSTGVAAVSGNAETLADAINRADARMYSEKMHARR
jgi:diguanylate cyclase (GGDEF)-like protein